MSIRILVEKFHGVALHCAILKYVAFAGVKVSHLPHDTRKM